MIVWLYVILLVRNSMTTTTNFEQTVENLLIEATTKLINLRQQPLWRTELPSRCPPILWFGNTLSGKPKLLTLGANPSRQEYLRDSSDVAIQKVRQTNDESLLRYLEPPANRFRLLSHNEQLEDILHQKQLRTEIISGYNIYFLGNPYHWFGLAKAEPYNVEGFLRGFGASYYDQQDTQFRGIHIDLFPFATLQDFSSIQNLAYRDLFSQGWAQQVIAALVQLLKPQAILVFGRTNFRYFANYIDPALHKLSWRRCHSAAFTIGSAASFQVPIIGLSTNLGNPKGFNRASLRQFGAFVAQEMQFAA